MTRYKSTSFFSSIQGVFSKPNWKALFLFSLVKGRGNCTIACVTFEVPICTNKLMKNKYTHQKSFYP